MRTSIFSGIFAIVIALTAGTARAETTLFEVSKGGQRILLGGTIHLLHPSEFPLPPEFDAAYAAADELYLETDLTVVEGPAFGQKLAQAMLYPPGKTLTTELSPEVWEALSSYSKANQFPIQQFVGFDPAFVSIIMTVMTAQQKGINQGVDSHYFKKARADGMPVGELESAEEVLGYMEALTGLDGDHIIEATLQELNRFDELMDSTVKAWKTGDLDTLFEDMGKPMKNEAPEMYRTLMVERNEDWLPIIKQMFTDDDVELVLVGSLHLAGEEGLLTRLESAGYQIAPFTLPH